MGREEKGVEGVMFISLREAESETELEREGLMIVCACAVSMNKEAF